MPALAFLLLARTAGANPTGLTVVSGSATTQTGGSQLNITTSSGAQLNWSSFNIGMGEKTVFNLPSATSVVFNQINNQSASQIYGSLQANGVVVLLNSSGFYFGPNSFVSAAGLVVSTASCLPPQNAGGTWVFNGPPPLASIVNYGQIKIGRGGDCFFIGDHVENHGHIEAPGGSIAFAAGQTVMLSERPDGRGMSMQVTLPQGSVDNYGNVVADGGIIALNAQVVNQNGFIQANSVRDNHGVIELVASDALNLGADSKISANGDTSPGGSRGGSITLKSNHTFNDVSGSDITIAGGANGGDGGAVEISAPAMPALKTKIDGHASADSKGGNLLLDPDFIVLDQAGTDTPTVNGSSGTVQAVSNPGGALHLNVGTAANGFNDSAFLGLSQITLQAQYDILFADGTAWSLSDSTAQSSGQLTLQAGRNIIFGNNTALYDAGNWSVALYAGVTDFAQNKVTPGAGSIYLNAFVPVYDDSSPSVPDGIISPPDDLNTTVASIMTAAGSITLVAGQDITVAAGRVVTTGGGSISAHALAGSIDTGGYAQGYVFQGADSAADGYNIDLGLGVGGISTMAGGSVTLIAGGDVMSVLPGKSTYYLHGNTDDAGNNPNFDLTAQATAGAGAYGLGALGDVNIVAGGNVKGHYVVADGTGSIFAGVKMDANGNPMKDGSGKYILGGTGSAGTDTDNPNLALSLIKGGWNVTAAQDIILQEVRNPNGVFNTVDKTSGSFHSFDYDSADYVNLTAGNQVHLGASASLLPRLDTLKVPVIYPGILSIMAGAGGVVLSGDSTFNQLILFPARQAGVGVGKLTIKTTDGGSLTGKVQSNSSTLQYFTLLMSDSDHAQYNPRSSTSSLFGLTDHAATPLHQADDTFKLSISGDMNTVLVGAPEKAEITVGGNMNNCRFQGMNLNAGDTTSIKVTGNIVNRGDFTTLDLGQVAGAGEPDLSLISRAITAAGDPSVATLLSNLSYDSKTHILTYENIPSVSLNTVLNLLQNLTIQVYVNGQPQWQNPPFDTIPVTTKVSVLNAVTAQALLAGYAAQGVAPKNDASGYIIGGGGTFEIMAHNLDLGTTAGIQSLGAGFYKLNGLYPLAETSDTGAIIQVNLTGDLDMFSTSIASLNGGSIYLNADGSINVGSPIFTVNSLGARGIFSTGQGNVAVYAGGDINVDGSRIAVYDTRPTSPAINTPGGSLTVLSRNGNVNVGSGGSGAVVVNSYYVNSGTKVVTTQTPVIPGSGIMECSYNLVGNALVEAPNGNINVGAGGLQQFLFRNSPFNEDALASLFRLALENHDAAAKSLQLKINGVIPGSPVPTEDIYAGSVLQNNHLPLLDKFGNPTVNADNLSDGTLASVAPGKNINASGSGIAGAGDLNILASGSFDGNVFALGNVSLKAIDNINATVFGLGTVSVATSGGTISGTIIGVGGIDASGGSIDASLESNGSISGATSGNSGFGASASAGNAAAGAAAETSPQTAGKSGDNADDELNKKKKGIALAQKVSRVTVILPKKN